MDHDQRFKILIQTFFAQQRAFERLVAGESYQGVQAMNTTWYEKGIEKGIEKERRESLRELLKEKFAPLSPTVLARLDQLPVERLQPLRKALLKANSLHELGLGD